MPDKQTIDRARADKRAGKSASTQAGEFVRREIDQIRKGKHGAKNAKQAIAIGLSEARRAGVDVGENPNRKSSGKSSGNARKPSASRTRSKSSASRSGPARRSTAPRTATKRKSTSSRSAAALRTSTTKRATRKAGATSRSRSQAALKALKKLPRRAASHLALSRQAHRTARTRTKADRSAAARKAARTRAANRAGR